MKKLLLIAGIFCITLPVFAQDMELFHRFQDDKLSMPMVPSGLSFPEFQLLERSVTLMDMAAGIAFPGYISFKAKEPVAGYAAMGARVLGYAGALYELYRFDEVGAATMANNRTDRAVGYATAGILAASFLFDWVYGKVQLEKKQEAIRFKYRLKN